jgi:tetratricopeptide (TPR) repeat protein
MILAFLHQRDGNAPEANRVAEEAVTFLRTLPTSNKPKHRQALAEVLADQGLIRWRTGRVEDAATALEEAVAIMGGLIANQARPADMQSSLETSLASVTVRQAHLLEHTGHVAEAEVAYEKAVRLRRHLAEKNVRGESFGRAQDMNEYVSAPNNWAGSLCELAWFHLRRGQVRRAESFFAEARTVHEELVAAYPSSMSAQNPLAWFLVTCPVERLRDPARAVRLARSAFAGNQISDYARTLGAAEFRAGDFRGAAADLDLAVRLRDSPPEADELFFRAMARWHLGEAEAARRDYDEALRGLEWPHYGHAAFLQQLREEAAAVLGVK